MFQNLSMRIRHDKTENLLIIDDNLGSQNFIISTMLILTLINAVINLFLVLNDAQKSMFGYIYVLLGVFSAVVLIYRYVKKTSKNRIGLDNIKSLEKKDLFGRKRFSLMLNDGKSRDLPELRSEEDIDNLKNVLQHSTSKEEV